MGYVLAHVRNCGHLSRKREAEEEGNLGGGWREVVIRVRHTRAKEKEREGEFGVAERTSRLAVVAERAMHHGIA